MGEFDVNMFDEVDYCILCELLEDGCVLDVVIGECIYLFSSLVVCWCKVMEESGIIVGYDVCFDMGKLGFSGVVVVVIELVL